MKNTLWYEKQATEWIEGLPIGNGRLAAMVWGDECSDRLSLNHEWLWRGVHRNRDNEPSAKHLPEIRRSLHDGNFFKATSLANTFLGGLGGKSGIKGRVDAYQPAGDLTFKMKESQFNKRQLNIDDALVTVERTVNNENITSSFITHPLHNLIIGRWHSEEGQFSGEMNFVRTEDVNAIEQLFIEGNKITFICSFNGGISYKVEVTVKTDGSLSCNDKSLFVDNAKYVIAYINIATSESGMDDEIMRYPIPDTSWDDLLVSHKAEFSKIFGRLALDIDLPEINKPTDEIIHDLKKGLENPALMLLFFNYGRYLLMSSSICGELPANLQGKWNDSINPAWECDYHFNINIQMNYWMAEASNMPECVESLLKYVERFIPHARKAAKDLYGCRGIWLPLTADAWGRATPEAQGWDVWIGAAPWIAQHFWWHYEYSGDIEFLKNRAYTFFKEVASFYEDYLIEDENGSMQIMPSQSPENRFEGTGSWPVSIGVSSSSDVQLAYDALGYAIKSAKILGVDSELCDKWSEMQRKLPPLAIGLDGRLLEWEIEREEIEPGHRHIAHLYGLHPSNIINPIDAPKQYEAAIKSLDYRLAQGGGHTGWSRAWVACFFARIGNPDKVWEHLRGVIKEFTSITLLDLCPWRETYVFQIDGNLGAVAAILESIVQYWGGKVHLLRALPKAWENGKLSGVKVQGGHELIIEWKDSEIISLNIKLGYSKRLILADLADKLDVPENIQIVGNDIFIEGYIGEDIAISGKTKMQNLII